MIRRLLHSRNFLACLLAAATGLVLYNHLHPFPLHYSLLLSGLYIFALRVPQRIRPGRPPRYPDPCKRPSRAGTTQKKSRGEPPTTEAATSIQDMPATRLRKLGWKSIVNGIP